MTTFALAPLERIPARRAPGTATEADLLRRPDGEARLYEVMDGVLVEKAIGFYEPVLAGVLVACSGSSSRTTILGSYSCRTAGCASGQV